MAPLRGMSVPLAQAGFFTGQGKFGMRRLAGIQGTFDPETGLASAASCDPSTLQGWPRLNATFTCFHPLTGFHITSATTDEKLLGKCPPFPPKPALDRSATYERLWPQQFREGTRPGCDLRRARAAPLPRILVPHLVPRDERVA